MRFPSREGISKKYRKEKRLGNVTSVEEGSYYYPITKTICLDCGCVFERMNEEVLNNYHKESKYFID